MASKKIPPPKVLGKPYDITRVGQKLDVEGQIYTCTGLRVRNGAKGAVLVADVVANCPVCGAAFSAYLPASGARLYVTRRCDAHKAKGVAVNPTWAQRMARGRAIAQRKASRDIFG